MQIRIRADEMIIAISGLSGSGKNAVGELVAKKLGLSVVSFSFKSEAKETGVSLMEFQKKANADKKIDLDFDKRIADVASKGNCVVTTWLGPWMVKNADLRVWLSASPKIRSERVSKRDKMTVPEALSHITARDNDNRARYKKLYNIDIDNHEEFDICLKSEKLTQDQLSNVIMCFINEQKKKA